MSQDNLLVRRAEPPNAETRLELQEGLITPTASFYVRCNFPVPTDWPGLALAGLLERPVERAALDR